MFIAPESQKVGYYDLSGSVEGLTKKSLVLFVTVTEVKYVFGSREHHNIVM